MKKKAKTFKWKASNDRETVKLAYKHSQFDITALKPSGKNTGRKKDLCTSSPATYATSG